MRVLALDAALGRASAAMLHGDRVLAEASEDGAPGAAARLPLLARTVLAGAGAPPAMVAVTVGPGGFTGLRAALALAHGLGLGFGIPVAGVGVAEALRAMRPDGMADGADARSCWVAIAARRGFVFLDRDGATALHALDALPKPDGPTILIGDAAEAAAAALAARGITVACGIERLPCIRAVARLGLSRAAGPLPLLPAQPIYVEPPRVTTPGAARLAEPAR